MVLRGGIRPPKTGLKEDKSNEMNKFKQILAIFTDRKQHFKILITI